MLKFFPTSDLQLLTQLLSVTKIRVLLVHQKQIYLEGIQMTVLELTGKNGGISLQLTSLQIKRVETSSQSE